MDILQDFGDFATAPTAGRISIRRINVVRLFEEGTRDLVFLQRGRIRDSGGFIRGDLP